MFLRLLEKFWGCKHKRFSFPQTTKGRTYVACLDCGGEWDYDWKEMKRARPGA